MTLSSALISAMILLPSISLADKVNHTDSAISIDGVHDAQWDHAQWRQLDKPIIGELPDAADFQGRYKLLWDANRLYLIAEITDDVLFDQHANPTHLYWDDDCLEIFLDEDASGGDHKTNFNAFAYHVALDNQSADVGPNREDGSTNFILLNDHVQSVWKRDPNSPNKLYWEMAITVYGDDFTLGGDAKPKQLTAGKIMGFMLAYCDNDGSKERENFIGSHDIEPVDGDKNRGWIDAGVFGKIELVK